MKTLYIFLTRSGTLLSNLVYSLTGAQYTHISLAFDEDLSTLYSSTRKNGYTMFPAGPSREYLNRGVFRLRENVPCALYALDVSDEAYTRARRRADGAAVRRIPERTLFAWATLGGGIGATAGMLLFRHKTRHWYFRLFFPLLAALQTAAALWLARMG